MGKRRRRIARARRASSADIRFTMVMVALGALVLVLVSALLGQVRQHDWKDAAISGGIALALLGVGVYSAFQRRRR